MLRLIEAPAVDAVVKQVADQEVTEAEALSAALDWLYEFEQISAKRQTSDKNRSNEAAVDMLLAVGLM